MDYRDIPREQRRYVCKSEYIRMSKEEKRLYLKHIRKLVFELGELDSSSSGTESTTSVANVKVPGRIYPDEGITKVCARVVALQKPDHLSAPRVNFVGMKSRGGHIFS